jgi:hypothetical protein
VELVFDERKLLTPGVHEVSLDAVKETFGSFQKSDRRPKLFEKLLEYLDAVKRAGTGASVIVDGSFVMAGIDEPDDIDLVLVLPADWDIDADLRPYQYNVVSKKAVRRTFGFDQITVTANSPEERAWIEYFGRVNIKWREK